MTRGRCFPWVAIVREQAVAVCVPGWSVGGGVPRVGAYMRDTLLAAGTRVSVLDLATSRSDPDSSRLAEPRTFLDRPRVRISGPDSERCGSHLAEIEPLRYLPRRCLTERLNEFDLVVLVAGVPAWANVLRHVEVPRILQVATTVTWERRYMYTDLSILKRAYRRAQGMVVHRLDETGILTADHVLVENKQMLHWVASRRGDATRVSLQPPGIDTSRFVGSPTWNPRLPLISVGRLGESRKGWDRLLHAYRYLIDEWPDCPDLLLVGKGELTARVESLVPRLSLESRVRVVSNPSDTELVRLLQGCSLFVTTPFEEGLGLAALEAMACGLPVVATVTDGSEQYVIPGKTGELVSQETNVLPEEFSAAVQRVLRDRTSDYSLHARDFCHENYGTSATSEALLQLFQLALTGGLR